MPFVVKIQKIPRFYWSTLSTPHGITELIININRIYVSHRHEHTRYREKSFTKFSFSAFQLFLTMYKQKYNQNYGQHGSYSRYHGRQYGGYRSDSAAPSSYGAQPRIVLDDYNSDLNFVIEPDGVKGSSLHKDGFEYMWAGARATYGVRTGKVQYPIKSRYR